MRVNQQQGLLDIAYLRQRSEEMPFMLANSQAGPRGVLCNPAVVANGWAQPLAPPNPRTRDELMNFSGKFKF